MDFSSINSPPDSATPLNVELTSATSSSIPFSPSPSSVTPQHPKVHASLSLTVGNFLNSIVGAGIIGIPFSLRHTGLLAGLFLLVLVGYLTAFSVKLIIGLGRQLECDNYESLAMKIFGRRGFTTVSLFMALLGFGAMIAYMVVIGDVVPHLLGVEKSTTARVMSIIVVSATTMLPLALLKSMASLSFTSSASVLADLVLVIIVIFASPVGESVSSAGGFWTVLGSSIIRPSTLFSGVGGERSERASFEKDENTQVCAGLRWMGG